ncbi:MAG: selenoneine biosynthesis selenosugar synthase SenB, partial [Gemmataceae bacterium]
MACPAPPRSRTGNRVTAVRWAAILRELGHAVRILSPCPRSDGPGCEVPRTAGCDALIALHAVKSAPAVAEFKRAHAARPALVALTGTDIFQDGGTASVLNESLRLSDRIIALQNHMASAVPPEFRYKVRVIFQSFVPPHPLPEPDPDVFEVCVLGHLRTVKDPFLTAKAVRALPPESRIKVTHVGGALEPGYAEHARQEQATNRRYEWLGELPRAEAVRTLARCRLLVMSSKSEGGPSAVSEAVACGVPVLSTPTSGVVGLLGDAYPGYFPVGDCGALKVLLVRCETDPAFVAELRSACDV